jgi:hypothetical protein
MPEIVGTHPDYRRRGLVRNQFDLMHKWSADRGELFNTIMGIGYYYRQFGYEYALNAWGGSMTSPDLLNQVSFKDEEKVPFTARDAQRSDARFISSTYENTHKRSFVTVTRNTKVFEQEIFGQSEGNATHWRARIFEQGDQPVGFYCYGVELKKKTIRVDMFEIDPSVNWLDASKSLLIDLQELANRFKPEGKDNSEKIEFSFGRSHPLYRMYGEVLGAPKRGYAWYVRVPDVAKLISHLTPLFESRLAESVMRGWSGEVKISFYRDGLHMSFDSGKLISATNTGFIENSDANAMYPDLTFLKALFAQQSFSQLSETIPDCSSEDHAAGTLQDILFGGPLPSAVLQVS